LPDLLVKLYQLPDRESSNLKDQMTRKIVFRRAMAYEKHQIVRWVREHFNERWSSECDVAFSNRPISCHIATENGAILGFACYDSTSMGMFGPIGVIESARWQGIGSTLLLFSLHSMAALGYAYAIVGAASSMRFYERVVGQSGVIKIADSTPGIYADRLKE
jgi:hypothetical protein